MLKKVADVKHNFNLENMEDMDIDLDAIADYIDIDDEMDLIFRGEYGTFCEKIKVVVDKFKEEVEDFVRDLPPLSRCELTGSGIRNRELKRVLLEVIRYHNPHIISFFYVL